MTCGLFEWDITIPERSAAPSWSGPRKAILSFQTDGADGQWKLPLSVGRRLLRLKREGSFDPASRNELAHKIKEESLSCGTLRVEALLNKRDYSSKELFEKLRRDGFSDEVSSKLVDRAVRGNLVNDERFASVYVRSKSYAGWGRRKIELELSRKGIDCESLAGWPDDFFSDDDEGERALSLARRRRLTGRNDFQKIVRYLCGKGYSMNVAFEAAKTALEERSGESESV